MPNSLNHFTKVHFGCVLYTIRPWYQNPKVEQPETPPPLPRVRRDPCLIVRLVRDQMELICFGYWEDKTLLIDYQNQHNIQKPTATWHLRCEYCLILRTTPVGWNVSLRVQDRAPLYLSSINKKTLVVFLRMVSKKGVSQVDL